MPRRSSPQKQGCSKTNQSSENLTSRAFAVQAKPESTDQSAGGQLAESQNLHPTPAEFSMFDVGIGRSLLIQPKLTIGAPGDKYEQEADHVAQQVVQRINAPQTDAPAVAPLEPTVQRVTLPEEEELQTKPMLQRKIAAPTEPNEQALVSQPTPAPASHPVVSVDLKQQPILQRQAGLGGQAVSADVESTIRQAQGRGHPLDASLQESMGQAIGFNLAGVRVHTDGQADRLNQVLQAKAFTTGQDVFFRHGMYQPQNPSGQELIAHELTHVVQQSKGQLPHQLSKKTQPERSPSQPTVAAPLSQHISHKQASIQRVETQVVVTGVSHLVKMVNNTIYGGEEADEIIHGQQLVIDTDGKKSSRRGPNQEDFSDVDKTGKHHYHWYKVISIDGKKAAKGLYVRSDVFVSAEPEKTASSSKLDTANTVVGAVTNVPGTLIGNEGITGVADALNDKTIKTNTGGGSRATDSDKAHAANMGIVGDSITGVTGLLALAKGFKDLGDPQKKATDLLGTGLEIQQGAMKTGESVSKLVHTASGESTSTAQKFGSAFEGYGAAFAGIKDAFFAMKDVVDLIKNNQDYTTEEKAKKSTEIGLRALQSARSIVLSIKAFIELVHGAASGGLMAAIPGLDIAIAGVKLIMDSYYLAISNSSRKVMNERRKEIAKTQNKTTDELNQISETYRTKDAEISNVKSVLMADKARLAKNPKAADKKRLEERVKGLEERLVKLEKEVEDQSVEREEIAEYTMVTELRDANTKRVIRQSVHIATEMMNIAGSIATLTGYGALGGAITKGTAAAVELSLPAARLAKQAGRDRAARKIVKGKYESSKFDHTKSTAAKADFRLKQVKYLVKMIVDLLYKNLKEHRADFDRVEGYLTASGIDTDRLFREKSPQKQIEMLVAAIQMREFM